MPLRDVIMDDDDTAQCWRRVSGLMSAALAISKFPQREILHHFDSIEIVRDRLSEILDKAEGK